MSTKAIVAIVIAAAFVLIVATLLVRAARNRRLDARRTEARDLHRQARKRELRAEREQALADERAAVARRAGAEAEIRAQSAREEGRFARDQRKKALAVDPDADERGGRRG